jgi:signal transduction histidine kinase
MSEILSKANPRVGILTKVLIPVLVSLVLLPLIIGAIFASYLTRQQQINGQDDLTTAQRVFEASLNNRLRELTSRFRGVAVSPQFIPVATALAVGSAEEGTPARALARKQGLLSDQLEIFGDECQVIAFTVAPPSTAVIAQKQRRVPERANGDLGVGFSETEFAANARTITETAARSGEAASGIVTVGTAVFYAVAVPVEDDDLSLGTATFGQRLDESTVQNLKRITNAEIVLTGPGGVLVSTLSNAAVPQEQAGEVLLDGVHYLARAGAYEAVSPHRGLHYTLLISVEASLAMREDMNRLVVSISLAGIVLSALAVWYFTRRSMRPLQGLRDSAEAIGRGDFTRRIERYSNDEVGDLAQAFNRMTDNLRESRAELEQMVDTLKATQVQLIQSEKLSAVGQFVSGVAHELNNPLAAVIGFSELLALTNEDTALKPHLNMIVKSAQRCHKIVQNLLSFARQHPPERSQVSINATIDEVLEFMAYEFRTSNITIQKRYEEGLPTILADPHQLQQIFVNILGNARQAIQAFRSDGTISVVTSRIDQMIRVELADNGPGIRPENLSRIFDPFFTTKAVGKGTGLGLSLCYGMIREHGGNIRVESVLGHGATFLIDFPAAEEAPARPGAAPAVEAGRSGQRAPASGYTVLVVDDEDWILSLASQLLAQDGHGSVPVRSGEEAIAALGQRRFDLILSDWKMPGLSGAQFYAHLQAIDPATAQRIIFMSGDVMNDGLRDFIAKHNKVCIPKPFPIAEFSAAIAAQLAKG